MARCEKQKTKENPTDTGPKGEPLFKGLAGEEKVDKKRNQHEKPTDSMGRHPEVKGKLKASLKKRPGGHVKNQNKKRRPHRFGPELPGDGNGGDILRPKNKKGMRHSQHSYKHPIFLVQLNQSVHTNHSVEKPHARDQNQLNHHQNRRHHSHQLSAAKKDAVQTEFVFDGEGFKKKWNGKGPGKGQGQGKKGEPQKGTATMDSHGP